MIGGGALMVAGAIGQYEAAQDAKDAARKQGEAAGRAADAQEKQFRLQRKQADIQNVRQLRAAIREARIRRGVVVNAGATTGTLASSGVQGGASSIGAQHASNVTFFNQMEDLGQQTTAAQTEQARAIGEGGQAAAAGNAAAADAAMWGAIGSLGSTIFAASSKPAAGA